MAIIVAGTIVLLSFVLWLERRADIFGFIERMCGLVVRHLERERWTQWLIRHTSGMYGKRERE